MKVIVKGSNKREFKVGDIVKDNGGTYLIISDISYYMLLDLKTLKCLCSYQDIAELVKFNTNLVKIDTLEFEVWLIF